MNVSSIKTPGVYINEIDAFPRSVAQVATAIPAFVGYTEKGPTAPTKIVSMLEYQQLFGGSPTPATITIELDSDNLPTDNTVAEESAYNLYNSLQLFYANGGGECYIVSVGNYSAGGNNIVKQDFLDGLTKLKSYDEPTLMLFPDAVELSAAELGEVQKQALKQCQELMDRFTIMDVMQQVDLDSDCGEFRDNVGNNNLKYGAAYYPYLVGNFSPSDFNYESINNALPTGRKFINLYEDAKESIEKFESYLDDLKLLNNKNNSTNKSLILNIKTPAKLKEGLDKCINILKTIGNSTSYSDNSELLSQLESIISSNLKIYLQNIKSFEEAYNQLEDVVIDPALDFSAFSSVWGDIPPIALNPNPYSGKLGETNETDAKSDYSRIQSEYNKLQTKIIQEVDNAINSLTADKNFMESNLISQLPLYNSIVSKLSQSMNTTPPSGAMAGIYAQTDATRGVWKAPANVSVNGITALTDDINDSEQEPMNVHETGKSINAIRKFTGRGFLVWGTRTLDGNSNDWRYINVRRLANMIEESVKNACTHYVFEPNTAQTWVNVKAMIENYLTTVWSDGGLAGTKPEHAFFVQIGLNQTMTALDILEGRMIVKIGYAPTRPAEFIILEFTQILQQS